MEESKIFVSKDFLKGMKSLRDIVVGYDFLSEGEVKLIDSVTKMFHDKDLLQKE